MKYIRQVNFKCKELFYLYGLICFGLCLFSQIHKLNCLGYVNIFISYATGRFEAAVKAKITFVQECDELLCGRKFPLLLNGTVYNPYRASNSIWK